MRSNYGKNGNVTVYVKKKTHEKGSKEIFVKKICKFVIAEFVKTYDELVIDLIWMLKKLIWILTDM